LGIERYKLEVRNVMKKIMDPTIPGRAETVVAEKGFTLIETMVACLVLVFGLLSVASLLSFSVASNYENRADSVGTMLAVQKMEQLRAQPASSLADGGSALDSTGGIDYSQTAVSGYAQTITGLGNQSFDVRWNVSTSNGLRKIVVAARRSNAAKRFMTNVLKPVNIRCLKQP
jgi:Tfp pilus assembly protein PilV